MKAETEEVVSAFGRAAYCMWKAVPPTLIQVLNLAGFYMQSLLLLKQGSESVWILCFQCLLKEMGDSELESHLCYSNSD